MCVDGTWDMIFHSMFKKKPDDNVTVYSPSHPLCTVECNCEYDMLTPVSSHSNQYPWCSRSLLEASSKFFKILVHWQFLKYNQHSPEARQLLYLPKLNFDRKQIKAQYRQYHSILKNEGLLPDGFLPPACWDYLQVSCFDFRWCSWTTIDELVNWWSTQRMCTWCTITWRYSKWRQHRTPEAQSDTYPWASHKNRL